MHLRAEPSRLRWHWTGKKHAKSEANARGRMGSIGQKERAWGVFLLLGIEMGKLELLLKGERNEFGISLTGLSLLQGPMDANFLSIICLPCVV